MNLKNLETPCLILDKQRLQTNITALHQHLQNLDVNLRPHGKTAKNIDTIRMALAGQSGGIAVSTVKEAEYYFDHGITDIVYAVGIVPVKLERLIRLIKNGARITVILDSVDQVRFLAVRGQEYDLEIPALIEIDCDGHRSGVKPDDVLLIDIGHLLEREEGVSLAGVLTHAGESYHCKSIEEIRSLARVERDAAIKSADKLRLNSLPCPIVSIGSTPTAVLAEELTGITEVRAGVFMFYDLVMAGTGVCGVEDIALTVLTSVIGYQKEKNRVITDAGWMALSRDRGTASQKVDRGYGLVCNFEGKLLSGLQVTATNQEHGIISNTIGREIDWKKFSVGSVLRILPNHACATAAMFDRYYVIDRTTTVLDVWQRINHW